MSEEEREKLIEAMLAAWERVEWTESTIIKMRAAFAAFEITHVVVPREPTEVMLTKGVIELPSWLENDDTDRKYAGDVYKAMIGAVHR